MVRLGLALRVIASLSVAELFALLGSVTVAGGVTVALLTAFCAQASGLATSAALMMIAAAMERRDCGSRGPGQTASSCAARGMSSVRRRSAPMDRRWRPPPPPRAGCRAT